MEVAVDLRFLDFDYSEDTEGVGTFDALASVAAAQWSALQTEVVQLLGWAQRHWGEAQPLAEGGVWDVALEATQESVQPLTCHFIPGRPELALQPDGAPQARYSLSLTLCGNEAFCAAFRAHGGEGG